MLGKTENRGGSVSNPLEEQKTRKIALPNIGKTEKQRKMAFPTLGRTKNAVGCISQPSERRRTPKIRQKTFGARFILTHPPYIVCCRNLFHSENLLQELLDAAFRLCFLCDSWGAL